MIVSIAFFPLDFFPCVHYISVYVETCCFLTNVSLSLKHSISRQTLPLLVVLRSPWWFFSFFASRISETTLLLLLLERSWPQNWWLIIGPLGVSLREELGAGGGDKNRIYKPDKGYWQEPNLNRARCLLVDFNISKSNQGELIWNKNSTKETTTLCWESAQ